MKPKRLTLRRKADETNWEKKMEKFYGLYGGVYPNCKCHFCNPEPSEEE